MYIQYTIYIIMYMYTGNIKQTDPKSLVHYYVCNGFIKSCRVRQMIRRAWCVNMMSGSSDNLQHDGVLHAGFDHVMSLDLINSLAVFRGASLSLIPWSIQQLRI